MDARRERQLPGGRPYNPVGGKGWRPPAPRFGLETSFVIFVLLLFRLLRYYVPFLLYFALRHPAMLRDTAG